MTNFKGTGKVSGSVRGSVETEKVMVMVASNAPNGVVTVDRV